MSVESGGNIFTFLNIFSFGFGVKTFLILFLVFYAVFAFVLYTQIGQMSKKLPSSVDPSLKFIGFIHFGLSLAFLFISIGILI